MNKFINILGVRIDPTTIKKYYVDNEYIALTVDFIHGELLLIKHNGRGAEALKILDKVFLYE